MEYQIARQRIKMVGLHYTRLAEQTRAGRARMRKSGEKFGENRSKCESRVKEKKADTKWLLEQLKARPPIKIEKGGGVRDAIAVVLCEAIAAVGDKDAIAQAKAIRTDRYEREILDLPPDSRALPHGRDTAP